MPDTLTASVAPRIDAVDPAEWQRLFPDAVHSLPMVQLMHRTGADGFKFHSIVIRENERPILLLPLFETDYRLSMLVGNEAYNLVRRLGRCVPSLKNLRLLGVGFVESAWGQVGIDPETDRATLGAAWDLALQILEWLMEGLKIDVTAFVNFTAHSGRMFPMEKLGGFSPIEGLPFSQVPIPYKHVDDYTASLSPAMRGKLRHKLRKAQAVHVLRTRRPGPWLESIYRFYLEAYPRGEGGFNVHSREFFQSVCQQIDDAEYVLYFIDEKLAAFRLQVVKPECLIDKCFGMDPVLGREYGLYFIAWFKAIEYCIANRIPLYHSGVNYEQTKERLGAQWMPSRILFRHRRPLIHVILSKVAGHLAYRPAMALPPTRLGCDWQKLPLIQSNGHQTASNDEAVGNALNPEHSKGWLCKH